MTGAILSLAGSPQRTAAMGAAGREYVIEHFSRARLAEELSQFLEEIRRINGR
jgi:glycosyltransferase involved in cell wall biosynthesis